MSSNRSATAATAAKTRSKGSPKDSRRWAVSRTRRRGAATSAAAVGSRRSRTRLRIWWSASTTVFPVTKIRSASIPSAARFAAASAVGAKQKSETVSVIRRSISSGKGDHFSRLRSPASTCPSLPCWKKVTTPAKNTVAVSPCTMVTSGRKSSATSRRPSMQAWPTS